MQSAAEVASLTAVSMRSATVGSSSMIGDQVDAVGAGQVHVEQHARDLPSPQNPQRLLPRRRDDHLVTQLDEVLADGVANRLLVIHDEERHGATAQRHAGSFTRDRTPEAATGWLERGMDGK